MNQSAPDRFESVLNNIFRLKRKTAMQSAFDILNPSTAKSPILRAVLRKLNELPNRRGKKDATCSADTDGAFDAIVLLSNKVQGLMQFLDEEEQEDLDAALCNAVIHISTIPIAASTSNGDSNRIRTDVDEPSPPPIELGTALAENNSLRQHIESLERQLVYVKTDREKASIAQRAVVSQHSKDNSILRSSLTKSRKEVEDMKKMCYEKERLYQTTLTQLVASQDEVKRLKIELRHLSDGIAESKDLIGRGYGSSKYGFEEVMSLRAVNDTLRYELSKERSARSVEKLSLQSGIDGIRIKSTSVESQISDMRELLESERRRCTAAEEEQHRLQLQLQALQFEFTKADAKRTEASLEVDRLKEKVAALQSEYDEIARSKERSEKDWSDRCNEMSDSMRALRVGLAELQGELATVASKGGDEIQRLTLERSRITLRLEALLEENEQLWASSKIQDKHLRRSGEVINSLSNQLHFGNTADNSLGGRSSQADSELLRGRVAQLQIANTLEIEEKWARRLATETEQLSQELKSVQAALEQEQSTRQSLESEIVKDTVMMTDQLKVMEQRLKLLSVENEQLREINGCLHNDTEAAQEEIKALSTRISSYKEDDVKLDLTSLIAQLEDYCLGETTISFSAAEILHNLVNSMQHSLRIALDVTNEDQDIERDRKDQDDRDWLLTKLLLDSDKAIHLPLQVIIKVLNSIDLAIEQWEAEHSGLTAQLNSIGEQLLAEQAAAQERLQNSDFHPTTHIQMIREHMEEELRRVHDNSLQQSLVLQKQLEEQAQLLQQKSEEVMAGKVQVVSIRSHLEQALGDLHAAQDELDDMRKRTGEYQEQIYRLQLEHHNEYVSSDDGEIASRHSSPGRQGAPTSPQNRRTSLTVETHDFSGSPIRGLSSGELTTQLQSPRGGRFRDSPTPSRVRSHSASDATAFSETSSYESYSGSPSREFESPKSEIRFLRAKLAEARTLLGKHVRDEGTLREANIEISTQTTPIRERNAPIAMTNEPVRTAIGFTQTASSPIPLQKSSHTIATSPFPDSSGDTAISKLKSRGYSSENRSLISPANSPRSSSIQYPDSSQSRLPDAAGTVSLPPISPSSSPKRTTPRKTSFSEDGIANQDNILPVAPTNLTALNLPSASLPTPVNSARSASTAHSSEPVTGIQAVSISLGGSVNDASYDRYQDLQGEGSSDEDRLIIANLKSKLIRAERQIQSLLQPNLADSNNSGRGPRTIHKPNGSNVDSEISSSDSEPVLRPNSSAESGADTSMRLSKDGSGNSTAFLSSSVRNPREVLAAGLSPKSRRNSHRVEKQSGIDYGISNSIDSTDSKLSAPSRAANPEADAIAREAEEHITVLSSLLQHADAKCKALEQQIQSMPASLHIAHAENRVVEAKLEKALSASELLLQEKTEQFVRETEELKAFLSIQGSEKAELQNKMQQQALTIHQLTLHLQLLQTAQHHADEQIYNHPLRRIAPAPWEPRSLPTGESSSVTVKDSTPAPVARVLSNPEIGASNYQKSFSLEQPIQIALESKLPGRLVNRKFPEISSDNVTAESPARMMQKQHPATPTSNQIMSDSSIDTKFSRGSQPTGNYISTPSIVIAHPNRSQFLPATELVHGPQNPALSAIPLLRTADIPQPPIAFRSELQKPDTVPSGKSLMQPPLMPANFATPMVGIAANPSSLKDNRERFDRFTRILSNRGVIA